MNKILFCFILVALVLGAVSCSMDIGDDGSSSSILDDYYEIYSRDGGEISSVFGKEEVSSSDKVSLTLKTDSSDENVFIRYAFSEKEEFNFYPSSSNPGRLIKLTPEEDEKKISSVTSKFVLFAVCYDRFNWSDAEFGYWEVENYVETSSKLKVTFAQTGESLVVSATDENGSNIVSSSIVRYTLDGTDPNSSSPLYVTGTGTITVSFGTTVKAKAFAVDSYEDSEVESYFMSGTPSSTSSDKYFYIDSTFANQKVKITFENGDGTSGEYTIASDGKIPVVVKGNQKITINLIVDGKWCDAGGNEGTYSQCQTTDWNDDKVIFTSYKNGTFDPTGTKVTWTVK